MTRYEYRVHPANAVIELLSPKRFDMPDAFLASDLETDTIRETVDSGFRWVRTDGDYAIFEREVAVQGSGSSATG